MNKRVIRAFLVLMCAVVCIGGGIGHVNAFTNDQRKELELRTFWDPTDVGTCSADSTASAATTAPTSGRLYMIGDSITEGTKSQLTSALSAKGYSGVDINGVSSRRLSEGSTDKDGLTVLNTDKARWSNASVVVVELGTNGGLSDKNITAAMNLLKTSKAKVYWVNIGVDNTKRTGTKIDAGPVNALLTSSATKNGFTVIDWSAAVKAHPDYIDPNPATGLGVHPFTSTGRPGFASVVANGITGSTLDTTAVSSGSSCNVSNVSSIDLTGSDRAEQVFNFLKQKGLTAIQAAGIMGNMQAEAHFEPMLVEYGWPNSRGEKSVAGKPSSLDDNVPPNVGPQGQPGYGIIQWTSPGRKDGLRALVAAKGTKGSDLGTQLEYLWSELNGPYKARVLEPIQATSSLEVATYTFLEKFEVPADIAGNKPVRLGFAQSIMRQAWAK